MAFIQLTESVPHQPPEIVHHTRDAGELHAG